MFLSKGKSLPITTCTCKSVKLWKTLWIWNLVVNQNHLLIATIHFLFKSNLQTSGVSLFVNKCSGSGWYQQGNNRIRWLSLVKNMHHFYGENTAGESDFHFSATTMDVASQPPKDVSQQFINWKEQWTVQSPINQTQRFWWVLLSASEFTVGVMLWSPGSQPHSSPLGIHSTEVLPLDPNGDYLVE